MTEKELNYLEGIINEEIQDYINSGYPKSDDYVKTLREILKKLHLQEYFDYDKWGDDKEWKTYQ